MSPASRERAARNAELMTYPYKASYQGICYRTPADDDGSPTDTPEPWVQTTGTGWKASEIDLGGGRTPVL